MTGATHLPLFNIPCFCSISVTAVPRSPMQDQGLIALYQKPVKVRSLKRSNNGGRINKRTERQVTCQTVTVLGLQSGAPDSNSPLPRALRFLMQMNYSKVNSSKQRHNLIMRLELNMQMVRGSSTPSPPFPAVFTHESMDCQVWVYKTDVCYLYTCLYI